ncbi:segregation/condensation protein A [Methanothrix soehngenii]|uniref:segregation/condensation protein A n=1 Tax=Methanothrix soehngenii TaxID=2223 RepID=UPI00300D7679
MELARRGDIDPWDIDIARTTEKFLQYIDSLEKRDLRIPARTLLYASILLRMKSDSMEGQKEVADEEPEPELEEVGGGGLGRGEGEHPSPPASEEAHQEAGNLRRADLGAEEGGDGRPEKGHERPLALH